MNTEYILYLGLHTLETAMILAAPLLITCMGIGILVSLFQAVTSLRDMTLTMVPKLLCMGFVAILFGNWMLQVIIQFTHEIFNQIQTYGY